ncbi:MAG: hypothetical protein V7K27_02060 [Nostoc sp.]|uniref:hypothetical protein n=1 Tax=Nostoc sp. TaxID=1180 RepID=UPI002FF780C7
MTEENQPDDFEQSQNEWDAVAETRQWSSAATELNCFALARRKGKRLVKIINPKVEPFPIICIFEDYPK